MWTCPKCNTPVEPPLTVCRSCGTAAADGALVSGAETNGIVPLQAAVPPPRQETALARMFAGAKAGALWGALYGAAFAIMIWMILTSFGIARPDTWLTDFPQRLLGIALVFSVVTAVFGALLRLVTVRRRPGEPPV